MTSELELERARQIDIHNPEQWMELPSNHPGIEWGSQLEDCGEVQFIEAVTLNGVRYTDVACDPDDSNVIWVRSKKPQSH
jgi:hypothetical protein